MPRTMPHTTKDHHPDNSQHPVAAKIVEFMNDQSISVDTSIDAMRMPLLEGDAIDSLGIVQLMMFLGTEFGVEIEEEDFVEENFATVGSLAGLVEGKLKQAA